MSDQPKKSKATNPQVGLAGGPARQNQTTERRRQDMAARSVLSRLRNRKSALK